jgi:ribonuclease BN (tRNA processing enzyme)
MQLTILGSGTATPNLERNASGLAIRAAEAGVGKLVLTHFYPPCEDVDVVQQAAGFFSGEIVKARDLMVIEM